MLCLLYDKPDDPFVLQCAPSIERGLPSSMVPSKSITKWYPIWLNPRARCIRSMSFALKSCPALVAEQWIIIESMLFIWFFLLIINTTFVSLIRRRDSVLSFYFVLFVFYIRLTRDEQDGFLFKDISQPTAEIAAIFQVVVILLR